MQPRRQQREPARARFGRDPPRAPVPSRRPRCGRRAPRLASAEPAYPRSAIPRPSLSPLGRSLSTSPWAIIARFASVLHFDDESVPPGGHLPGVRPRPGDPYSGRPWPSGAAVCSGREQVSRRRTRSGPDALGGPAPSPRSDPRRRSGPASARARRCCRRPSSGTDRLAQRGAEEPAGVVESPAATRPCARRRRRRRQRPPAAHRRPGKSSARSRAGYTASTTTMSAAASAPPNSRRASACARTGAAGTPRPAARGSSVRAAAITAATSVGWWA